MSTAGAERIAASHQPGSLQRNLDGLLHDIQRETSIPGISLALSINGTRLYSSIGTMAVDSTIAMTADARFQLGCITKLIVAMLAGELIEQRRLDPEAPIASYLPELAETDRAGRLATWHLLSHTSGYKGVNVSRPDIAYYYSWPKFVEHLRRAPQHFAPGAVFSYEHTEYVILGEIIERITRRNIESLASEYIFDSLDLRPGRVRSDQHDPKICVVDHVLSSGSRQYGKLKPIPFGAFWRASLSDFTLSVMDMLRLAERIGGFGDHAPARPSQGAMRFIQQQVVKLPRVCGSSRPEQLPAAFGLGCAAYRGWLLGHNGSARGQTVGLRFDPHNRIAVVVGMNAWQPFLRDMIVNHVFSVLRRQPIPLPANEPFHFALADLPGRYDGYDGLTIDVSRSEDNAVTCSVPGPGTAPPLLLTLKLDERGALVMSGDAQHHSIGFFREEASGALGMMFGLVACRKLY